MTKDQTEKGVAELAQQCAVIGATRYLQANGLKADPSALADCLMSWIKAKLPEALHDAREAYEANMAQVGETTFRATMMQAGIEAAKEAGFPA